MMNRITKFYIKTEQCYKTLRLRETEDMEALVLRTESSAAAPRLLPQDLGWVSGPQLFFL